LACLAACAAKPKDAESKAPDEAAEEVQGATAPVNPNLRALVVDTSRCSASGGRTDQVDLNHDGRGDLVAIYQGQGAQADQLACKQADLNFDGRIDAYFHFDDKGEIVREQFDLDFDGRIDLGRHYKGKDLEYDEQDLDRDGFVDAWRRYDKGRLLTIQVDRDGDGKPDMYTYYLSGRIDRVGYDVNGDGRVDQWDHDAARRARLAENSRTTKQTEAADKKAGEEYVEEPGKDKGKAADDTAKVDDKAKGTGDKAKPDAKGDKTKPDAKGDKAKPDAKGDKTKPDAGAPATSDKPAAGATPTAPTKPAAPSKPAASSKPAEPIKPTKPTTQSPGGSGPAPTPVKPKGTTAPK
jgi:hypothetical protein